MNTVRKARRINRKLTPEEEERLKIARAQVEQELPELLERGRMAKAASQENTASGALRRAIHGDNLTLPQIARQVGITTTELDMFLTGESTLQSDVIDRLVETLGCKLVQTEKISNS